MKEGPPKPPEVTEAIAHGDKAYLRNAGRKGGRRTADIRAWQKEQRTKLLSETTIAVQYQEILHVEGEEPAEKWLQELCGKANSNT
jgi:hypothetical protein